MGGVHSSKTREFCEEMVEILESVARGLSDLANDLKYESAFSSVTRLELVHFLTTLARKTVATLNDDAFKVSGENRSHLLHTAVSLNKIAAAIQQDGPSSSNGAASSVSLSSSECQRLVGAIETFIPALRTLTSWLSDLPLSPVKRLLALLKEATTALLNAFVPVSENHVPAHPSAFPALRQASAKPRRVAGRWLPIGFRPAPEQSGLATGLTLIPLLLDYLETEDTEHLPSIQQRGSAPTATSERSSTVVRSTTRPAPGQPADQATKPVNPLTRPAFSQTHRPPPPVSSYYQQFSRQPGFRRAALDPNRFFRRNKPGVAPQLRLRGSQLASPPGLQQRDVHPQRP